MKIYISVVWALFAFLIVSCGKSKTLESKPWEHGALMVSKDNRMLKHTDGTGFFWMADTAWQMSYKLNKEEVELYLENRKDKGFSVIQMSAVMKGEFPSNTQGDVPFNNNAIKNPNEPYWKNIDYIIDTAEEKGLYVALLPAWFGVLSSNMNDVNTYASFIANRYKNKKNIIWIIGGDAGDKKYANPNNTWETNEKIWNSVGKTIDKIVGNKQLITYHPCGYCSSRDWFKDADWIDFHMIQSGHGGDINRANKLLVKQYMDTKKPILDGEPRYETILKGFVEKNGRYTSDDVRQVAYTQVFSGAFGHTYGHHSIWQFWESGRVDCCGTTQDGKTWIKALDDNGAKYVGYLAKLMKSRPILNRIPDSSVIVSGNAKATRGNGYAFVYLPEGGEVEVDFSKLSKGKVKVWWYDPRTEVASNEGVFENRHLFTAGKKDMVLVVDDISKNYPMPGALYRQPKEK